MLSSEGLLRLIRRLSLINPSADKPVSRPVRANGHVSFSLTQESVHHPAAIGVVADNAAEVVNAIDISGRCTSKVKVAKAGVRKLEAVIHVVRVHPNADNNPFGSDTGSNRFVGVRVVDGPKDAAFVGKAVHGIVHVKVIADDISASINSDQYGALGVGIIDDLFTA